MKMKKYFIMTAFAMLVFASCTNNEDQSEPQEINFSTLNYKPTKAPITGTAYTKANGCPAFGVFAILVSEGKKYDESAVAERSSYMSNVKIDFNDNNDYKIWTPYSGSNPIKYYWPLSGSLAFVGYTPYDISNKAAFTLSTKTLTITDYSPSTTVAQQYDVMYSKAGVAKDLNKNETSYTGANVNNSKGVNIVFNHALSQIIFKAKTTVLATDATFKIDEIKMIDVENNGTLTVTNDVATGGVDGWSLTADNKTTFNVTTEATSDLTNDFDQYCGKLLLIPQTFASTSTAQVSIKYTMTPTHSGSTPTSKTVIKSMKDLSGLTTINANKKYIINLTISPEEILFAPSILEWEDGGSSDL